MYISSEYLFHDPSDYAAKKASITNFKILLTSIIGGESGVELAMYYRTP